MEEMAELTSDEVRNRHGAILNEMEAVNVDNYSCGYVGLVDYMTRLNKVSRSLLKSMDDENEAIALRLSCHEASRYIHDQSVVVMDLNNTI